MPIVTVTSDFGVADPFVGIMKGVALSIEPSINFVDITHDISPQNITQAIYVIASSFEYFPKGTVHLCVVDPGVGGERKPVAFAAGGYYFVGPDNGIFTEVIRRARPVEIHEITARDKMLPNVSSTFHGRDIFAPVAAWIAKGVKLSAFGPAMDQLVTLDMPWAMRPSSDLVVGEIIYVDRFGNAVTNLTRPLLEHARRSQNAQWLKITIGETIVENILHHYGEGDDEHSLFATFGSWDTLEFFVKNGDASFFYGLNVGDGVEVRFY